MDPQVIARVCHEANRALCEATGDMSQLPWTTASGWQIDSAIDGVKFAIANPDATPEAQHNAWVEAKIAGGWSWGEIKDPEKKTHPAILPFNKLAPEVQAKDKLFHAIVTALKD